MIDQITILHREPRKYLIESVKNPATYSGEDLIPWLKTHYSGNKPNGGLWTSSHTPDDDYVCDWQRGLATNAAVQLAYPPDASLKTFKLKCTECEILNIASLDDAVNVTEQYRLSRLSLPAELANGLGKLITAEITDWKRLTAFDAIHLTAEAADQVMHAKLTTGLHTAFDTWNCESTLWNRWCFCSVEQVVSHVRI